MEGGLIFRSIHEFENSLSMSDRIAVLKRQPEGLSWIARLADNPTAEFSGKSPSEALGCLLRGNGWTMSEVVLNMDPDRSNISAGHAEVLIRVRRPGLETVCPDCRGSGRYVGLSVVETCHACGGRKVVHC